MSMTDPEALFGRLRAARVHYPRDEILDAFVRQAADPERAAQHFWARCGTPDGALAKTCIDAFLADWEHLIRLCES